MHGLNIFFGILSSNEIFIMSLFMEKTTLGDVCSSIESVIMELQSTLNSLSTVDSCLVSSEGPSSLLLSSNFDSDFINSAATKFNKKLDNLDNSDKVCHETSSIFQHKLQSKNLDRAGKGIEDSSNHQKLVTSVKRRLL